MMNHKCANMNDGKSEELCNDKINKHDQAMNGLENMSAALLGLVRLIADIETVDGGSVPNKDPEGRSGISLSEFLDTIPSVLNEKAEQIRNATVRLRELLF